MIINATTGGAGLNFNVVGGTAQPTSPKENTVWVNTATGISSWVFSATQPSSPSAGMVWFQAGTSAPASFNALKKNNITVYPNGCKQYVSGAWQSKTAKTYQGGTWKEWATYLFKEGSGKQVPFTVANMDNGSVNIGNDYIYMYAPSGGYGEKSFYTTNKVDLTNVKTILFDLKVDVGDVTVGVGSQINATTAPQTASTKVGACARKLVSVDVSSLTGSYYVGAQSGDYAKTAYIYNIYYSK